MPEPLLTRYLQPLMAGRRAECFEIINHAITDGQHADAMIRDVVWPAMTQIERLFRSDRINSAIESMACRINRTVAAQLQAHLPRKAHNGKRVLVHSACGEGEEIGAQLVGDLFQADGWEVYFLGGAVPHDEVLTLVGQLRPDVLLIFGTRPQDVPETRRLIEMVREIGVCSAMNVVVSGGVFNRAEGLWLEIGADVYAESAKDVLRLANELRPREANAPRLGIVKKRRRRRRMAAV
ncbi:MAG: cobalamin-dependent protein [Phycisphaerae bacterium]